MQEDFRTFDEGRNAERSHSLCLVTLDSISQLSQLSQLRQGDRQPFGILPPLELFDRESSGTPSAVKDMSKALEVPRAVEAPMPKDLEAYKKVDQLFAKMTDDDFQTREAAGKELTDLMYSSRANYAACLAYIRDQRSQFNPEQQSYCNDALKKGACHTDITNPCEIAKDLQMYSKNPKLLEEKLKVLKFLDSLPEDERYGTHGGLMDKAPYWTSDRLNGMLRNMEKLQEQMKGAPRNADGSYTPPIVLDYMATTLRYCGEHPETKAVIVDFVKELAKNPRKLFENIPAKETFAFDDIAATYLAAGGDPKILQQVRRDFTRGIVAGEPFKDFRGNEHPIRSMSNWNP